MTPKPKPPETQVVTRCVRCKKEHVIAEGYPSRFTMKELLEGIAATNFHECPHS